MVPQKEAPKEEVSHWNSDLTKGLSRFPQRRCLRIGGDDGIQLMVGGDPCFAF